MFVPKEGLFGSCLHFIAQFKSSSRLPWSGRDRWKCGRIVGLAFSRVRRTGHSLAIAALTWVLAASPSLAIDVSSVRGALSLVNRSVTQDQGAWVVDYRVRYTGKTGVIVTPEKIAVKVEGWVSNSRVASHALPRWSSLFVPHGPDLSAISEVVAASDEAHRCRERLIVSVWTEDQDPSRAVPAQAAPAPRPKPTPAGHCPAEAATWSPLEPGTRRHRARPAPA